MQCSVCKGPLLEGASACDACGAPIQGAPPTERFDSGKPAFVPGALDAYAIAPHPAESPQLGSLPTTRELTTPQPSPMAISPSSPLPVARSPYAQSLPTIPIAVAPAYGGAPPRFAPPQGPTLVSPQPIVPPPYAYPPVGPNVPPQNYVAVASFVCGLLGLVPFHVGLVLCALAIGLGIAGISRAAVLPGNLGRGLAIAGLVLGLVFILPAGCGL